MILGLGLGIVVFVGMFVTALLVDAIEELEK